MTDVHIRLAELLTLVTFCIGAIVTLVKISAKVSRILGSFESMLKNFPPHRHINGTVIYPDDFEPTVPQNLYPQERGKGASA